MMELATCPACASRFPAEVRPGLALRCPACGHAFGIPAADAAPTLPVYPLDPSAADDTDDATNDADDAKAGTAVPLCPGCDRRVGWQAARCPYCGEEFEEFGTSADRHAPPLRRDGERHRAGMLAALSNTALILSGLGLCSEGVLSLLAIPFAAAAWVMAARDLGKIRAGIMDADGRRSTEFARNSAIGAILLSLFFLGLLAFFRVLAI